MKIRYAVLAVLCALFFSEEAFPATYTYYLPYYSYTADQWTGVALRNCSTTAGAAVTVAVYPEGGGSPAWTGNPISIPSSGQWVNMVGTSTTGTGNYTGTGWIKVTSDQTLTGLCFVGGTNSPVLMFDITLISELSILLHVPHVAQNDTTYVWDTQIMICNPNGSAASVTMRYVDVEGTVKKTLACTIAANGSGRYDLSTILQGTTCLNGSVEIQSSVGVAAFALYKNTRDPGHVSYAGISAVKPETGLLYNYYIPRFDTTGSKWTGLALRNASTTTGATVSLMVYRENGGLPVWTSKPVSPISIDPSGQWVNMVGTSATGTSNYTGTGWIKILSTTPLTGLCFIARTTPDDLMYDITMISEITSPLYVPHVAQSNATSVWDTSVMVCNPNLSSATVTCTFFKSDGTTLTPVSYSLPANGSRVCEVSDLTKGVNYLSGSVEISSTQGVAAFALYHSLNSPGGEKYYAGICAVPYPKGSGGDPYDGQWVGSATSVPLTAYCGTATIQMTIADSIITGIAVDSWGESYELSGEVHPDGTIEAAMASGDEENLAQFSGQMTGNTGSGTWEDVEGCSGTWELTLQSL